MLVLGVHTGLQQASDDPRQSTWEFHDTAAVLLEDGNVIAGIEEERLTRIKHCTHFPARAIAYCLAERRISLSEVDRIAMNWRESTYDFLAASRFMSDPSIRTPPSGREALTWLFEQEFEVDVSDKLRFCDHHVAHATSAYALSGFADSLVLSLDGFGDGRSGVVLVASEDKYEVMRQFGIAQSLGLFYEQMINFLGYSRFDEYKCMGLAPYGDPAVFADLFRRWYRLLPGGDYTLVSAPERLEDLRVRDLLRHARREGDDLTDVHKDFAACLQAFLEGIALHVIGHYQKETGQRNLVIAGGVGHNCSMNGKLLYARLFDRVFIQPAAHDAGGALGAALEITRHEGVKRHGASRLEHLYWGTGIGNDEEVGRILANWASLLSVRSSSLVAEETAALLAGGAVVGWVQGKSEFGPRALGNRSILADPRPAENRLRINQMVKKREAYRPFAPSVLEERLAEFFELPNDDTAFPFMINTLRVRPSAREFLGAITHVDGTARVQTVSKARNGVFWQLISAFDRLTGCPMVLNTSLNNDVEPIVDSVEHAVACYLTTGLTNLIVGRHMIERKGLTRSDEMEAYKTLVVTIAPHRFLVERSERGGGGKEYLLANNLRREFSQPAARVSEAAMSCLRHANGSNTVGEILRYAGLRDDDQLFAVIGELRRLWSRRAISLHPIDRSR